MLTHNAMRQPVYIKDKYQDIIQLFLYISGTYLVHYYTYCIPQRLADRDEEGAAVEGSLGDYKTWDRPS